MSEPLRITAHISGEIAGIFAHPFMLDAPLSFSWFAREWQRGNQPPPIDEAPDANLPLQRWEQAGTWGWCTSRARFKVLKWGVREGKKMPNMTANARYTKNPKFHRALGAEKARAFVVETALVSPLEWDVLATDTSELRDLLDRTTHLGTWVASGLGLVDHWDITPIENPHAWEDRPMPEPGVTDRWRAPYWHPKREITGATTE